MSEKLIKLRYAGKCRSCQSKLEARIYAWWDLNVKQVTCVSCRSRSSQGSESPVKTGALTTNDSAIRTGLNSRGIDPGRPGGSAQAEFERRHSQREKRVEANWGRYLAPIVKRLSDDPQSTRAWASGAWGEEWVGGNLERLLGDTAVLLHDRRVTRNRGNLDHLAIASSGVWVIDAKNYDGRIELRDVGGWFSVDKRLYIGGWDRTELIDGLYWQVATVEACIADLDVPVRPILCLVKGWGRWQKPFEIDGTFVTWSTKLADWIAEPGPLNANTVERVATRLARAFPAK
ncbi:MAG: nuclease-related domain-containing protein [Acidimicrobiales bacterium]